MMARTISLLVLCLSIALVSGCDRGATAEKVEVVAILKTTENPYFREMVAGLKEASSRTEAIDALTIRSAGGEGDVVGQRQILDALYDAHVRGRDSPSVRALIITPASSSDALIPSLKRFTNAGVYIIVVDTRFDRAALERHGFEPDIFVGSSNFEGGKVAYRTLSQATAPSRQFLLLNGLDGHETAGARRAGFLDQMSDEEKALLIERTCDWSHSKARVTVEALLASGMRFDGIFAANDQMALGAAEAVKRAALSLSVPIVGFDGIEEAKTAVDNGELLATVMQQPALMGQEALAAANALVSGHSATDKIIQVTLYAKPTTAP